MKIAFFTVFYPPHLGGLEVYVENLAKHMKKLGHEVVIVTSNHSNLPSFEKKDITIYRLPSFGLFKNRYPIYRPGKELSKLLKSMHKENFDAIICNCRYFPINFIGLHMAKVANQRALLIDHSSSYITVSNPLLDICAICYEHLITSFIKYYRPLFYGVSQHTNNWLRRFKIHASGVLYNSVDVDIYNSCDNDTKNNDITILFVGRMLKEKGILLLLETFTKLNEKYDNLALYVAGDGPLLSEIKEKYKNPKIKFLGRMQHEQLMSLYSSADIFVNPSMYPEGFPTTILEAGLMGCAVVATDRGGTTELINSSDVGIISQEKTSDLYKKLELLVTQPDMRKTLGSNLSKRVRENFTWQKTANQLNSILQRQKDS